MERNLYGSKILNYRFFLLALFAFLSPVLLQLTDFWIFKISDDIVFGLILIDALIAVQKKNIEVKYNQVCLLVIVAFCLYLFFETFYAIINGNEFKVVFLQFRQYKYIFLFLVLLYYRDEIFPAMFNLAKVIAFISIFVSIMQRLMISNPSGDVVTGLYGYNASGIMTLFLLILFFTEFTQRLSQGISIFGWYFLFFIPIGLNETKIVFFMLPIMFVVSLIMSKKATFKNILILCACAAFLFFSTIMMYQQFYKSDLLSVFSTERLMTYMTEKSRYDLGRFSKIQIAYTIIDKTPTDRIFGYGIGAGFTGRQSKAFGVVAEKYSAQNLFFGTRPQLFNSLIDTGLLGVILQLLLIITVTIKIIFSKGKYQLHHFAAIFSLIVWSVGLFYQDILTASNLAFFMFTAIYLACLKDNLPMQMRLNHGD